MLIVSRKLHESIIINGNIEVCITDIGNGRVSLGIEAPREIPVHRKEIQERIDKAKASNPKSLS